ncbi:MAG TPA: hypothetical protein VKB31_04280 [Trueperaceae bacterium]|nr:hypothetical protein [Trueperaceae bacterium]
MTSGTDPLTSIERELAQERRAADALAKRLSAGSDRLLAIGKEQVDAYRELARLRVQALAAAGEGALAVPDALDDADRRVSDLLRSRQRTADALLVDIRAADAGRADRETAREACAQRLAAAAATVDAAEARTQARLEADDGYEQALADAHEADRIAMHADDKATVSERELDDKGRAFRGDPLFMYLWRRRFGTPEYRAAPPFRWLDGKVASLCRFMTAREDYARLLEIPGRLREHATACRRRADEAFGRVHALDQSARVADGIPALEAAEAEAATALHEADSRLEADAATARDLLERQRQMAAGEDDAYRQAVDVLAAALRADALQELHQQALATPFPEDDAVIARLETLERERRQLGSAVDELQAAVRQRHERLRDLESLRAEFKRRQYDQPGQGFEDGMLVATVLANVLGGMLGRDALWRILDQQRRSRPPQSNPTFGSGGFGRGSPWGGGFRTGGTGQRGGRFRTGGKF